MFSFFSLSNVRRFFFTFLVLVLLAAFLGGCDSNSDSNLDFTTDNLVQEGLLGRWVSGFGDWYQITRNTAGTEDTIRYENPGFDAWGGTIRRVTLFPEQSGVIIIELNEFGSKDSQRPFTAVYFLNFAPGVSVELNMVWDANDDDFNADTASLQAAINRFTFDNMGNYMDIDWSTVYTRQQ
jgi:hypothetical protein